MTTLGTAKARTNRETATFTVTALALALSGVVVPRLRRAYSSGDFDWKQIQTNQEIVR
jgi:hypothetical protein